MKALRFFAALPLIIAGLSAAVFASGGMQLPETMFTDLDEILKKAVQQSPTMLNRSLDLEIAESTRQQARAGLLPTLGGYTSYYKASDTRADLSGRLSVNKIAYNFSVTQPVFHWGDRRNSAQIGEIQANIAKGQYREGYRQLAQTLRSDYLKLIMQKIAVKRAAFYLKSAKSQLAQEEIRLAKKETSDAAIFAIRLAAEQAQIASERAQFEFEMAKTSFARLSGGSLLTDDAIPDSIPAVAYRSQEFDRLLTGYLNQKEKPTTEAWAMRQQLDIEKLNYTITKTRLRPKLNAVLGTSQDEQSYSLNVAQKYRVNSIFGGFSVSWSIFDGFASRAAQRSALARRRQLENDYKTLTEQLAQQAQSQVRLLNFSARAMAISDQALVTAVGNLKSKKEEYARGVISESDVNTVQLALFDAQLYAYNGRSDYLNRVGDFLGTIMEDPVVAYAPAN